MIEMKLLCKKMKEKKFFERQTIKKMEMEIIEQRY